MNEVPKRPRFALGHVVATPGALEALGHLGVQPETFLSRHVSGDWGDLEPEDRRANDEAIAHEGDHAQQARVFSAYRTATGKTIWVITEWDRSATTLLLPDEY